MIFFRQVRPLLCPQLQEAHQTPALHNCAQDSTEWRSCQIWQRAKGSEASRSHRPGEGSNFDKMGSSG